MKHVRLLALALLAGAPASPQRRPDPVVELQRNVGLLEDQVRKLQNSMEEKIGTLSGLLQQAVDNSNRTGAVLTQLETTLRDRLREQEKTLVAPVASLGSKVDHVGEETRALSANVAELTALVRKQQLQLTDLANAIRTLQTPPEPPKASDSAPGAAGPPPGVTAQSLYSNAYRDKLGGQADLAMQQFQDYLRFFPGTEHAANAQFYIGEIHFNRGEFDHAVRAFDTLLEKHPDNSKTPDALLMKGRAALKLGDKQEAIRNFREIGKRFPTSDVAARARQELKLLGYPPAQGRRRP
jgi:tol-pal system protein YbgF